MHNNPDDHPNYTIKDGNLLLHNRIYIPAELSLQSLLLARSHNSPIGGHAEIQGTFVRLSHTFYWLELQRSVHEFVWCYMPNHQSFNISPQGLLFHLPIPGKIWNSLSMDFITHLPPSFGKMTVLVVIDYLSKSAHFFLKEIQFTPPQVTFLFMTSCDFMDSPPWSSLTEIHSLWVHFGRNCSDYRGQPWLQMAPITHKPTDKRRSLSIARKMTFGALLQTSPVDGYSI